MADPVAGPRSGTNLRDVLFALSSIGKGGVCLHRYLARGVAAMMAAIPELGLSADAMFVVSMALAAQSAACPEIDTR